MLLQPVLFRSVHMQINGYRVHFVTEQFQMSSLPNSIQSEDYGGCGIRTFVLVPQHATLLLILLERAQRPSGLVNMPIEPLPIHSNQAICSGHYWPPLFESRCRA